MLFCFVMSQAPAGAKRGAGAKNRNPYAGETKGVSAEAQIDGQPPDLHVDRHCSNCNQCVHICGYNESINAQSQNVISTVFQACTSKLCFF